MGPRPFHGEYWSYPYYPPPHGYILPPDGHANGDGGPHGQPAHHPTYYPIHPRYPPVSMYPPPPGAFGPITTPPGQVPPLSKWKVIKLQLRMILALWQTRAERPKKKKHAGGEEGVSKSCRAEDTHMKAVVDPRHL
ncbi:hypothetical protein BGY98DRAFT_183262 [Russula aff. rugulosa BPL654]|nr:hypothetical protein BGY98DRAFT_183262 [Russula aff. rugulosa BPL654]